MKKYIIAIAAFLLAPSQVLGQNISFINAAAFSGAIQTIRIHDNRAFCTGHQSLEVFDISNPQALTLLGGYPLVSLNNDIELEGDYAYIAADNSGLLIFRITDFPIQEIYSSYASGGQAMDIQIVSNMVFIANGDSGLQIVDISNPLTPALLAECPTPSPVISVAVGHNFAFLATAFSDVYCIDISDPLDPQIAYTINTGWDIHKIAIKDDALYILNYHYYDMMIYGRIDIFDISEPGVPGLLSQINSSCEYFDITFTGNYALSANSYEGLTIYDIENPAEPVLVVSTGSGWYYDYISVAVSDSIAFIGSYDFIITYNIADISEPILWAEYNLPRGPEAMCNAGNLIYVGYTTGCQILDAANPAQPITLGGLYDYLSLNVIKDMCISGDYLYAACQLSVGLSIFDVSDSDSLYRVGYYLTGVMGCRTLCVRDSLIFIGGCHSPSFRIVDVSEPAYPQMVGDCNIQSLDSDLEIQDNYAFCQAHQGLHVVDFTDIENPEVIAVNNAIPYGKHLKVRDNYAYLASDSGRFGILDIADINNINLVGECAIPRGVRDLILVDEKVFLACAGVQVIDISLPSQPHIIESWQSPSTAIAIAYNDGTIYLCQGNSLLLLNYRQSPIDDDHSLNPQTFSLSQNCPNPFNASTVIKYELPQPSQVIIEIYDILGRKVSMLIDRHQPAGYHQAIWQADDFASGMYFYKLQVGEYTDTKKMLLIK